MTEQEALASSTKWVDGWHNFYGYLSFEAANVLVATGHYKYQQVCCWGYVVEKIK